MNNLIPWWAYAVTGAVATLVICIPLYMLRVDWLEKDADNRVTAAQAEAQNQHLKANHIAEDVSNGYQNNITDLHNRLATLKRLQPTRCVPVYAAATTADSNDQRAAGKFPGQGGVFAGDILDLGGACEEVRLQRNGLQDFIDKVWKANGQ